MRVIPNANLPREIVQVNDGEALLFQIKLLLFRKFSDMYKLNEKYLYCKYGYCYAVFDCCGRGPSKKDIQHTNRSGIVLPDITFTSDEKCIKSRDKFLDNQNNKDRFIAGLSNHLSQNHFQCVADTNRRVAKIVLEYHSWGKHAVVNADDADVLCVLIHHWKKAANTSRPWKVTQAIVIIFKKEPPIKIVAIKIIFWNQLDQKEFSWDSASCLMSVR